MTHRGPFQPLPFCDSVILCLQRRPVDVWGQEEGDKCNKTLVMVDASLPLKSQRS